MTSRKFVTVRGSVFSNWAGPTLHHKTHEETLGDCTTKDTQARLSRTGSTQLFIGGYAGLGMTPNEEAFLSALSE